MKKILQILFIFSLFVNISYCGEIDNKKQRQYEQTFQENLNRFQTKKVIYISIFRDDYLTSLRAEKTETYLHDIKNILTKYNKEKANNNHIYGLMAYNLYQNMYKTIEKTVNAEKEDDADLNNANLNELQAIAIPDNIYDHLEKELIYAIGFTNIILKNAK